MAKRTTPQSLEDLANCCGDLSRFMQAMLKDELPLDSEFMDWLLRIECTANMVLPVEKRPKGRPGEYVPPVSDPDQ